MSTGFDRGGSQSSPPKHNNLTSNPQDFHPPKSERARDGDGDGDGDRMRVLSPLSQSQADEEEEEDREEFVDAPDSQIADEPPPPRLPNNRDSLISQISSVSQNDDPSRPKTRRKPSEDPRWRKRIESSLIKLTAEVAALREQLESRRLFAHTLRFRIFKSVTSFIWGVVKHLTMDFLILGLVLLWLRRKKDRRFEGAIRVLLGDAVAQVQRVGEKQLRNVKLPGLGGGKRPN
jgi:hypothetical protein